MHSLPQARYIVFNFQWDKWVNYSSFFPPLIPGFLSKKQTRVIHENETAFPMVPVSWLPAAATLSWNLLFSFFVCLFYEGNSSPEWVWEQVANFSALKGAWYRRQGSERTLLGLGSPGWMTSGLSFAYLTPKREEKSLQSYLVLACLPGPGSISLGIWKILSKFHSSGWLLSSHVEILNLGTTDTVDRIILCCRWLSCAFRMWQHPWLPPTRGQ